FAEACRVGLQPRRRHAAQRVAGRGSHYCVARARQPDARGPSCARRVSGGRLRRRRCALSRRRDADLRRRLGGCRSSCEARVTAGNAGIALVLAVSAVAAAAPLVAPDGSDDHYPRLLNAPPTLLHMRDEAGLHLPFIYPWRLTNQLEQQYEQDRSVRVPLA